MDPDLSGEGTRLPFHLFLVAPSGCQISLTAVCTQIGGAGGAHLESWLPSTATTFFSENNGSTYYHVHGVEN